MPSSNKTVSSKSSSDKSLQTAPSTNKSRPPHELAEALAELRTSLAAFKLTTDAVPAAKSAPSSTHASLGEQSTATPTSSLDQLSLTTSGPSTPKQKTADGSAQVNGVMESKALLVAACPHLDTRLARMLRNLHGFCPRDEPLEHEVTFSCKDRRSLGPLSLRYRAPKGVQLITNYFRQDSVIDALWSNLKKLMPDQPPHNVRPSVLFEENKDEVKGDTLACITLVCASVESFMLIRDNLHEIRVEDDAKHIGIYAQHIWSNTLAGDIFPIDILRLPLGVACLNEFFSALDHMASPVGSLLGVGVVGIDSWRGDDCTTTAGITRAYVQLYPSSMQLHFEDLIDRLPTRLQWEGVLYSIFYPGRDLHKVQKSSLDYPRVR